jgi:hypothetical protein
MKISEGVRPSNPDTDPVGKGSNIKEIEKRAHDSIPGFDSSLSCEDDTAVGNERGLFSTSLKAESSSY